MRRFSWNIVREAMNLRRAANSGARISVVLIFCLAALHCTYAIGQVVGSIRWDQCLNQTAGRYGSTDAKRIGDNVLAYQAPSGRWPKNIDMALTPERRRELTRVMNLLMDVADEKPGVGFVDHGRRARAAGAVKKGFACILKCQIVVDGRLTAWCAQHDEALLREEYPHWRETWAISFASRERGLAAILTARVCRVICFVSQSSTAREVGL